MSKSLILYVGFGVMVVAQLAVPGYMICQRELTLRNGVPYKFKTAPVDPFDPFRGRYVTLRISPEMAPYPPGGVVYRHQALFALLTEDEEGFAAVESVSLTRPESGDYIRIKAGWDSHANGRESQFRVRWPFDRYYFDESLAPEAERAYREHSRGEQRDAYVLVRVREGKAVIEELYIEDTPILDFVGANHG